MKIIEKSAKQNQERYEKITDCNTEKRPEEKTEKSETA